VFRFSQLYFTTSQERSCAPGKWKESGWSQAKLDHDNKNKFKVIISGLELFSSGPARSRNERGAKRANKSRIERGKVRGKELFQLPADLGDFPLFFFFDSVMTLLLAGW